MLTIPKPHHRWYDIVMIHGDAGYLSLFLAVVDIVLLLMQLYVLDVVPPISTISVGDVY